MAQQAPTGSRQTPHEVVVDAARHKISVLLSWAWRSENPGRFQYEEGVWRHTFFFSNSDTAFDFKMRFG